MSAAPRAPQRIEGTALPRQARQPRSPRISGLRRGTSVDLLSNFARLRGSSAVSGTARPASVNTRYSRPPLTTTAEPTTTPVALLATSASLAISAERPAISDRRCATLAGSNLLSVPAPERNQGFGLSGHGDGRPEGAAGLAAGEYEVRNHARVDTRFRCGACTPPATCGWSCPTTGGLRSRWGRADRCLGCPCERGPWLCRGPYICGILPRLIGRPVWVTGRPEAGAVLRGISGASGLSPAAQRRWAAKNCVVVAAPFATSEMWSTPG